MVFIVRQEKNTVFIFTILNDLAETIQAKDNGKIP